ncbi:MAG: hypothetical protein MK296_04395 [Gammaproteobacteria bacterium]|nr:hypothetical protein [Gammaproteobacteria bacterium]
MHHRTGMLWRRHHGKMPHPSEDSAPHDNQTVLETLMEIPCQAVLHGCG